MPSKSVIRACCLVGALMFCSAVAAERKAPLIGATREEVLARFGEPKSTIVAGSREVLFFTGERVVLRNNRVIEADEISVDQPPVAKPVVPSAPATGTSTDSVDTTGNAPAAKTPGGTDSSTSVAGSTGAGDASTAPVPVVPPPPEVVIKSIRPPSAHGTPTPDETAAPSPPAVAVVPATPTPLPVAPAETKPAAETAAAPAKPAAETAAAPAKPVADATVATAVPAPAEPVAPQNVPTDTTVPATSNVDAADAAAGTPATTEPQTSPKVDATAPAPAAAPPVKKSPTKSAHAEPSIPSATDSIFTARTYVLALVIIGGGVAFLIWRVRQRSLVLQVTAVSQHPFAPEAPTAGAGTRFTLDLLTKLEWKRFEDLVASYYNKTGVVATRTKTGPASPVHIRISWKGEQRPFACVQCVPRPAGLIEARQIQSLCEVLAAEDIRRGYVVTTGKFGVPARDLAEEKHITLLGGDIFLEKLNALPDAARSELMKDATTGDYTTPSCPACETKMARSTTDGSVWQCPACNAVLPRA